MEAARDVRGGGEMHAGDRGRGAERHIDIADRMCGTVGMARGRKGKADREMECTARVGSEVASRGQKQKTIGGGR